MPNLHSQIPTMPMYTLRKHILAQQAQKINLQKKSTAVLAVYIPQWSLSF